MEAVTTDDDWCVCVRVCARVCVGRVHLLEEQLRETEMRAADLLSEEQRRSRDIIVCVMFSPVLVLTFSLLHFVSFSAVIVFLDC